MKLRYTIPLFLTLVLVTSACRTVEEGPAHETRWGVPQATSPDEQPQQQPAPAPSSPTREPTSPERAPTAPQ